MQGQALGKGRGVADGLRITLGHCQFFKVAQPLLGLQWLCILTAYSSEMGMGGILNGLDLNGAKYLIIYASSSRISLGQN